MTKALARGETQAAVGRFQSSALKRQGVMTTTAPEKETHTPGPWYVTKDGNSIIQTSHFTRDVWVIPRNQADMNLIAAAPELLNGLKAVVEMFGPWHDTDCPADDTCECSAKPIHDLVNAAILKAEG